MTDFWGAVANLISGVVDDIFHHDVNEPLHSTDPDPSSGSSGSSGSSAQPVLHTLPPDAVQRIEAAFQARLGNPDAHNLTTHSNLTPVETPAEKAAHKLLDAADHGSHLGDPIKPQPIPVDPDLGDPNKPPHPTPIGPGGDGQHHIPAVLTQVADGSSNTIVVGEQGHLGHTIPTSGFAAALGGGLLAGGLPPPGQGGGVIDPPQPFHVADLHVADHAPDVSALHFDHAPAVHFDAAHH